MITFWRWEGDWRGRRRELSLLRPTRPYGWAFGLSLHHDNHPGEATTMLLVGPVLLSYWWSKS